MNTKKLTVALLSFALCATSVSLHEQEKKKSVGKTITKTASKVGNKTAEVAVKGAVAVTDQVYKGKMAPNGSNVYIDGKNHKYYVNKKGAKVYLKASQILDKPADQ